MKLAQRYNRINIITSFIILVITGLIYYFTIHFIFTEKLDKDLEIEENEIVAFVKNYGRLPDPGDFLNQTVKYTELKSKTPVERKFSYSDYYEQSENEVEPGRTLITSVKVGNQIFQIDITKSRVEFEDLVKLILVITVGVTLLLLITLLLINRLLLKRIWKPFYHTLNRMKDFNLTAKHSIAVERTNIDEFNELSDAALTMAESVNRDYRELKSFTDNASHEMMTPLAVVGAKLDLLVQGEALNDTQGQLIDEIYNAVSKLGRLNQSLILLAKIENKLIPEMEQIDLKQLIIQKANHFNELIIANSISLKLELSDKTVLMSSYLVEILLNNLFTNAIRHNVPNGVITISLTDGSLIFCNTGLATALDESHAFERFQKNPASDGMGLGLAIVKQIVALHNMHIAYNFNQNTHIFSIKF